MKRKELEKYIQEKLNKLEENYKKGLISKELYEQKKKFFLEKLQFVRTAPPQEIEMTSKDIIIQTIKKSIEDLKEKTRTITQFPLDIFKPYIFLFFAVMIVLIIYMFVRKK
jgi:hypothetical protein